MAFFSSLLRWLGLTGHRSGIGRAPPCHAPVASGGLESAELLNAAPILPVLTTACLHIPELSIPSWFRSEWRSHHLHGGGAQLQ